MSKKIPGRKRVTIDRFEGDSKQIAVLIDDDGTPYLRRRTALPEGAKPGDVLKHDLTHDRQATKSVAAYTDQIQRSMRREDNGKDIKFPKKSIGDQTSTIQRSMRRKDSGQDISIANRKHKGRAPRVTGSGASNQSGTDSDMRRRYGGDGGPEISAGGRWVTIRGHHFFLKNK